MFTPWKESYGQPRQDIKKQRHYFGNKGPFSLGYVFSSLFPVVYPVWIWELDYKESWALKNLCFWTVVLEKTLESPLDCKEFQPVHCKWDQSWMFIVRTDAEAETPILWPPDAKSWLSGKDPDAGKDWGQEEKGWQRMRFLDIITNSLDMGLGIWWWTGGLACCSSSWGHKELDTTERVNWTELKSLEVFPTFFNLSLNLAIRSSWSEPQSAPSLVFLDCIEVVHLWLQRM